MLPPAVRYPVAADWYELAGRPAVLDRLATRPGGPVAGFCLAADVGPDLGLAVVGSTPSNREVALQQVAIPLAALAARRAMASPGPFLRGGTAPSSSS